MAAETSNDVPAEISDDVAAETSNDETEEPKNRVWLIKIMEEQQKRMDKRVVPEQPKPRIPKVLDKALLQTESNNRYFEPLVVSFGPYHHGKEHLMPMEHYKNIAAAWFISRANDKPDEEATIVYEKFIERVKNVPSPTYWYDGNVFKFKSKEHFMRMMFLDGCLILYFIHLVDTWPSSSDEYISKSSHHLNKKHIVRDMFLLENQIPFQILESLMNLLPDQEMTGSSIIKFIFTVALPSYEMDFSPTGWLKVMIWIFKLYSPPEWELVFHSMWRCLFEAAGEEPLHLLHVLREVLLGVRDSPDSGSGSADHFKYYFRPIRELKEAGIQVTRSRGMTLKHLQFKWGLLNSHLEIPQIIVDNSTMGRLLNLVAYEMCPDGPKDHTVTSYICLLDYLIDHPEDVNELQKENILLNHLGSGEDVSNLFKKLAANLSPGGNFYAHVINGISEHYKRPFNNERVLIGQFLCTYFSSPWALISFIAATFAIVLTLLQTMYAIWGFYKTY